MATTPLSPVDAAWYHIDGPVNLAQVTGILLTREPLDFDRVKATYAHRLRGFDRFRQRVVEKGFPLATPHWEDMPHFDIDQHIHHIALPAPRDRRALMDLLSDLASTPLDRSLPLWQIHVIDDVDGGSALVMRFHHCLGDGTAMMALSQRLFDVSPDTPPEGPVGEEAPSAPATPPEAGWLDRLLSSAGEAIGWSVKAASATYEAALEAWGNPRQVMDRAGAVVDAAATLLNELVKPPDPPSPLKGPFGPQKRVAWSEPVSLDDVKTIGALSGAKVNDVLVAGMTGALRSYLASRGLDVDRLQLRAMVPVDLRPRDRALELGNDFGLVILDLPVHARYPLQRLRLAQAHMEALKRSPEAVAIRTLFTIFGRGPKIVEDLAVDLFSSKASVVLSNVAGPREPRYLAGVRIDRMMFWVPHPGKQLGMGISILSYDGRVSLAVISDAHLVPDPDAITARFDAEFKDMLRRARRAHARRKARAQ